MNENSYFNNNMNQPPQAIRNPGQTFATISMLMGLASLFTLFTIYLPLIFGSLSILFAILSKGYGKKMIVTARIGIISAIAGLSLLVTITGSLVGVLMSSTREDLVTVGRQMDNMLEQQMGVEPEELLGNSYEDIMRTYADLLGK